MSAQTPVTTQHRHRDDTGPGDVHLSFGRLVRSEWIKLRSIRSTVWCFSIVVVLTVALAALLGSSGGTGDTVSGTAADAQLVSINTASVLLTVLVVGVLGVLVISGEFGTGQVRSTFTADPGRVGVLLAKATVLAATTFVVSVVSTWIGVVASAAMQTAKDVHPDVASPSVAMPVLGASVYVTLVALLAFGVGLLVRSSAAGITITLGLLLVLPILLSLFAALMQAQWLADVSEFLPSNAGSHLYAFASGADGARPGLVLNGWSGFAVLAAEVVVVGGTAIAVARRRDV